MSSVTHEEAIEIAIQLSNSIGSRADKADTIGKFPKEDATDLRSSGYSKFNLPKSLGGWGLSMRTCVESHLILSSGSTSTGLVASMTMNVLGHEADVRNWPLFSCMYVHLDNVLFEQAGAPVFLDWSRPMLGPTVVNLAALIFEMSSLDHFGQIIDSYLKTFNAIGFPKLEKKDLIEQLGFALIFQFMQSTCGIAKWQPKIERGRKIIEVNIHRANGAGSFWQKREPQFFSFLFSEK